MSTLEEIKAQVAALSYEELAVFRQWFEEYDSDAWDRQMEEDAKAGKLDAFAEEALREYRAGRGTSL